MIGIGHRFRPQQRRRLPRRLYLFGLARDQKTPLLEGECRLPPEGRALRALLNLRATPFKIAHETESQVVLHIEDPGIPVASREEPSTPTVTMRSSPREAA